MSLTELNSLSKRIERLTTTLVPEREVKFVCVWGDEPLEADDASIIVTTWGGGRLEDDLELEEE